MTNPAFPDLRRKQRAKAVTPVTHRFVGDVDAPFVEQVLNLPKGNGTPLKRVLALGRSYWDHDQMRPAVRENYRKVLACGTAALGAEIYASANETRLVPHTCKSRACPSCGFRATTLWQRDQWRDLPDTPYSHVTFTMPDVLWSLFRQNRHLLHDLPVLGAKTIEHWVRHTYGVRLMIMVIPHTLGGHLNFNCHLHVLVSQSGLDANGTAWRKAPLNRNELMSLWRYAVVTYLREAHRRGVLDTDKTAAQVRHLLRKQQERWWSVKIQPSKGKKQFLRYAGRYVRRPPIAQGRFRYIDRDEVRFLTKDKRTKKWVTNHCHPDQQASFRAATSLNMLLAKRFEFRNRMICSIGLSSGLYGGRRRSVRLGGTRRSLERCQPAPSRTITPCAPGATAAPIAARCSFIDAVFALSATWAMPTPRSAQVAPNR